MGKICRNLRFGSKLTNEILNIKGNIILYEVPVDDSLVPKAFHL